MAQKAKVKQSLGVLSSTGAKRSAPGATKATAGNRDLDLGKISPVGVGLLTGEKEALKVLAAEQGITLNALMRFALRRFIVEVRAGVIDLNKEQDEPEPQKKKLKLPS